MGQDILGIKLIFQKIIMSSMLRFKGCIVDWKQSSVILRYFRTSRSIVCRPFRNKGFLVCLCRLFAVSGSNTKAHQSSNGSLPCHVGAFVCLVDLILLTLPTHA